MKNRTGRVMVVAAGLAAFMFISSCNIVGPAVYFIHGPEKTPAAFELPDDKSAVVLIDDVDSRLPSRVTRQRIAKSTEQALLENKCVLNAKIISSDAALAAVAGERFGKQLGISEIGEKVGAQVVIYARIENFALSPDGAQYAPMVRMRVKVVEVETKKRLFPAPESGDPSAQWFTVKYDLPIRQGVLPSQMGEVQKAEQELAEAAGLALGRVFFEHETRTRVNRVGD